MSENLFNQLPAGVAYTLELASVARLNECGVAKEATGACIEILSRGELLVAWRCRDGKTRFAGLPVKKGKG